MAARKTLTPQKRDVPVDSRGNVRVYADVPKSVAQEFTILAVRRDMSKRDLLAKLIMDAVAGK